MKAYELQQVRPGFHDAALGSQAVFRTALSALSHPGRVIEMPDVSALPRHGHGAAAMLLQALVDSDCAVWLSPTLAGTDAATWLRFHTGCHWAATPAAARF
ncbi:MAG: phosphonate C-P lyase system protein PhnH, partial [Hydrogenophaga sp.]|nr:phosphonate C-P lyase system protein PhnH [Hydrogenophaga sp.]